MHTHTYTHTHTHRRSCISAGIFIVISELQGERRQLVGLGANEGQQKEPCCFIVSRRPERHSGERQFLAQGISLHTWSSGPVCDGIRALLLIHQIDVICTHAHTNTLRNKNGDEREAERKEGAKEGDMNL